MSMSCYSALQPKWFKNGILLLNVETSESKGNHYTDKKRHNIHFSEVKLEDAGVYFCEGFNSTGFMYNSSSTLKVGSK